MRRTATTLLATSALVFGATLAGPALSASSHAKGGKANKGNGGGQSGSIALGTKTGNIQASYMFVVSGGSSTVTPVPGSTTSYALSMPMPSSTQPVIWFTVRPSRMTGTMPLSQFTGMWTQTNNGAFGFWVNPPNVAFTTVSGGNMSTFVAAMSSATLQVDATTGAATLAATLTALTGSTSAPPAQADKTTIFVERSVCASGKCVPKPIN